MTLASLHLLACIKPAWAATFCGFHALAVNDTGRGRGLAPCRPARALDQDSIDLAPNIAVAPIVKVMLNRREWRKVLRQSTPLAAGRQNIEDCIHDRAKMPLVSPSVIRNQRRESCGRAKLTHFFWGLFWVSLLGRLLGIWAMTGNTNR